MIKLRVYVALVMMTLGFPALAQQYYDDAQVWFNLDLEKKLSKRWAFHLKQQERFTNNVMQLGRFYGDVGLSFKINKNIKLQADYMFAQKQRNNGSYKTRHQYYFALHLKKEIDRWTILYRNRFQCMYEDPYMSADGTIPHYYDRNKLTLRYEFTKRLEPYIAEEITIPLNDPQLKGIKRSRSFIGLLINTTKHQQLELYFAYQIQLQKSDWYKQDISYPNEPLKRYYIYGIGYSFEF